MVQTEKIHKEVVLIVDDDHDSLKLLSMLLAKNPFRVITAASGEEALLKIAEERPNLMLSDVQMPGMDGFALTAAIRADKAYRNMPILLATGLNDDQQKIQGLEAGCDDFIAKPFDFTELNARVNSLLTLAKMRKQVSESEQFDFIFDKITDALIITDEAFNIIRHNFKAAELFGIENSGSVNFLDMAYQRYQCSVQRHLLEVMEEDVFSVEFFRPAHEYTEALFLQADIRLVKHQSFAGDRIIFFIKDITRSRVDENLKHDFLSLISHKLKSPLVVVNGMAQLLEEHLQKKLADKEREHLKRLLVNGRQLESLVEKLIDYSTFMNLNLLPHQMETFDPVVTFKAAVARKISQYINKVIRVEYDIDLVHKVQIDTLTVSQYGFIIGNLLENAIKFNIRPLIELNIRFSLSNNRVLIIEMEDNGVGIPEEELSKIFESFYQYEKIFTGNVEGIGIGLTMVRRLMEKLGGEITVVSIINKGSTFKLRLPLGGK
jgi:two-component system cell cycle response regulator